MDDSSASRSGSSKRIHTVVVEGLVLLRLIKHSREHAHQTVRGNLLGLEVDNGVCEVTNCFPTCDDGSVEYNVRVMKVMKEVNVDHNVVGWYSSMFLGTYFTKENVEHHADFQAAMPDSVLLMYDNVPSAQGLLSLKALRLTDAFMEEWQNQTRLGSEAFTRLAPSSIFEELPIKIRNSHLIQAYMADVIDSKVLTGMGAAATRPAPAPLSGLADKQASHFSASSSIAASVGNAVGVTPATVAAAELETDFARLDLATAPFLEKHLELIQGMGEQFLTAQANSRFIAREIANLVKDREDWLILRRRENEKRRMEGLDTLPEFDSSLPFFKPVTDKTGRDTLDTLLVSAQISAYCGSVMHFADQSFGKLFLAASLQKQ